MAHYTIADENQAPTGLTIEEFRIIGSQLRESHSRVDISNADANDFVDVAMALLDGKLVVFSPSDEAPF